MSAETEILPRLGLTPLATSAELAAARTSHLAGFKPGTPDASEDPESLDGPERIEIPAERLPKSIKGTLVLLEELRAEPATTARDQQIKQLTLQALARHLHAIQQVPVCKPLTNAQHATLSAIQTSHAKSIHLDALAKQFPEVQALLEENEALRRAKQFPEVQALLEENEALRRLCLAPTGSAEPYREAGAPATETVV